jgi:hypothetical protein
MPVKIEMTKDSPKIVLDEENSVFLIEGYSYMADAYKAYEGVLDWINKNSERIKNQLICEFKFNMLSSASRKMIYEILGLLNRTRFATKDIQIYWYYASYDEDMKEIGEIFSEQFELPFSFFPMEISEP